LHERWRNNPHSEEADAGLDMKADRRFPWSLLRGKKSHRKCDPFEDTHPAFLVSKAWCSWNSLFPVNGNRFHRYFDFNFSKGYSWSTLCTNEIVIDPSPTADATRFTF